MNERVDYKSLESEMIAALETKDRKSSLLEASLLEKDAQLEAVQAQLQVGGRAGRVGGRRTPALAVVVPAVVPPPVAGSEACLPACIHQM